MTQPASASTSSPAFKKTLTRSGEADLSRFATAIMVVVFLVAGHIWSVNTGLFLDDHAHYAHLRESPWTVDGLVKASRLGIVGDVMDLWGRHELGLRFFRPVAFAIMKVEYTLGHWKAWPLHLCSIGWHFIAAMLVGELAYLCLGQRLWATVAACFMAIHPGHVVTVAWIACQTELLTTVFLLSATLAYAHYAQWPRPAFLSPAPHPTLAHTPSPLLPKSSPPPLPRLGSGVLTRTVGACFSLLFYAAALGCRENAVLFPLICFAGDRLLVPRERRRFRMVPVIMLGILAAYLRIRFVYLEGFPVPGRPYIYRPSDPDFIRFVIEKIVYYTIGMFSFIPVLPMSGQSWFASHKSFFYGSFLGAIVCFLVIWSAYRFRRALLWPLVWIACTSAPLIPLIASPYHIYLPSVGAVLILSAGLAALGGVLRSMSPGLPPISRGQATVCIIVVLLHAFGLGLYSWGENFAFRYGTLTEDILIDEVMRRSTPIRDGDDFFFINMPALAYYAIPAIEMKTGRHNLHGHVLTFSPWMLRMEEPSTLEVLDDHRLRVTSPAGAGYFGGVSGQILLQTMGLHESLTAGKEIVDEQSGFTITPTRIDDHGVREIVFTFKRPLASPGYHFLFGSPQFLAYPVPLPRKLATSSTPG